ncbi:DUF58 domain-containing protein, partial [Paenibacillus sp. JTLBN-2024]
LPVLRGKGSAVRLFRFLQDMPPGREGSLSAALGQPGAIPRLKGMNWIFFRFFGLPKAKPTWETRFPAWRAPVRRSCWCRCCRPEEIRPELSGDLRLVDSELNTGKEVAITGRVLERYREELHRYQNELRKIASERGIYFVALSSGMTLQEAVFGTLAGSGLIRA